MEPSNIKIRFNVNSKDGKECWRVLVHGQEKLYDKVIIDGVASTTVDDLPDLGKKYHITIKRAVLMEAGGVASIRTVRESVPARPTKNFIITGLPRSRTAWLAALFCDGDVMCLHEPIMQTAHPISGKLNFKMMDAIISSIEKPFVGISDSSIPLQGSVEHYMTNYQEAPIVIIVRDNVEVFESYKRYTGFDHDDCIGIIGKVKDGLDKLMSSDRAKMVVRYEDLKYTSTLQAIWQFCVPGVPFNAQRAELYQSFIINRDFKKQ